MKFRPEPPYQHGRLPRAGVLLVNLGTPDAPTTGAVRRYLREFLSDPRVVEIPRAVWLPILYGIILTVRPPRSAHKYAQVWTEEGSPLAVHTARQARLLAGRLGAGPQPAPLVEYGMRYGNPPIGAALERLRAAGCERIAVIPLYPQYAASTTASVNDALQAHLARTRHLPDLRFVKHFHDHPGYIAALAARVRAHWAANGRGDKLVMSFHGVPRYSLDRGDPYHCECHATARLLAEALGLSPSQYMLTFQSRFGRAEWLQPYTEPSLEALAREGVKRVDVFCPGFVSDCLETLEEIALGARETFLHAGGEQFGFISCLNEDEAWIDALAALARQALGPALPPLAELEAQAALRAGRARALGAKDPAPGT